MSKTIKVLTYNIAHAKNYTDYLKLKNDIADFDQNKHLPVETDATANVIKNVDADVVGLNEVYNTGDYENKPYLTCQTQKIAAAANYPFSVFGRGQLFSWGQDIGNAILSKTPVTSFSATPIPAPSKEERRPNEKQWYEDRVIVTAEIEFDGKIVTVISTHFGCNLLEQERLTEKLIEIIDGVNTPLILMGDFNAYPDDEVLKPLYARLTSAADAIGKRNQFTFSTYSPGITIDYIFVSKEFSVKDYQVISSPVSDHFPVSATLNLK